MSKFRRVIVNLMVLGLIVSSMNSCEIFSSMTSDESELENDTISFDTESDISNETLAPVITEPSEIITEPPPETQPDLIGKAFSSSGTIKPDTNKLLKLHIEWKASQTADNEYADLDITIYLNCYAITVGARTNSKLIVDGEKIEFSTPVIINEQNSLSSIELHNETVKIHHPASEEIKSIEISAEFYFGGTYGGESIGWIEVSGVVNLSDDRSQISDNKTSETIKNPLAPELPSDPFKPVEE